MAVLLDLRTRERRKVRLYAEEGQDGGQEGTQPASRTLTYDIAVYTTCTKVL